MDTARDYYTGEVSHIVCLCQVKCDITYMWHLKYDTNEPIYETETDS